LRRHCVDDAAELIHYLIALDVHLEHRVPVTAKLSRKFYERLGDDIASELVDWFNAVDLTYQTQLREMNDLNWERFKATLLAESASIRSEIRGELHSGLAEVRTEMADMRAELLKWMFVYWTGTIIGLGGVIVAVLSRH
jgi:hypothetical protein